MSALPGRCLQYNVISATNYYARTTVTERPFLVVVICVFKRSSIGGVLERWSKITRSKTISYGIGMFRRW